MTYAEVRKKIGKARSHLLLGNGFSIDCHPVFQYQNLYDYAVSSGLSKTAEKVFKKLGTNNFEGVMRLLENANWVAQTYRLIPSGKSDLLKDKEVIKRALIGAVANTHLDDTGAIPNEKKEAALVFLSDFHNVFTTNYDLLLYWVVMHKGNPTFQDGFRTDPDNTDSLIFSQRIGDSKGIYYLHGALHLFFQDGEYRKHSWAKTEKKLTELVREGLKEDRYPLFVAEGDPEKKLEQIQHSGYLWYCLDKLARIKGPLIVFGHSLGTSDTHIIDRVAGNRDLEEVFVGLHGDPESKNNLAIRQAGAEMKQKRKNLHRSTPLNIQYFDSDSAGVWGLQK